MMRFGNFLFVLAFGLASVAALAEDKGTAQEPPEFSEAETTLWMTDQLAMIEKPVKLTYEFKKDGVYEEGFGDIVELRILDVKDDGMKHAAIRFFTGERNQFVPENESTNVNPVLGIFLQGDMYEMDRLTEGHWRYFHRRLKFAFADNARVEDVTVEFEGQQLPAKRVTVMPYIEDERRADMGVFARKIYSILISDKVPGYLYEVQTLVPPEKEGGPVLMNEVLRLSKAEPIPQ